MHKGSAIGRSLLIRNTTDREFVTKKVFERIRVPSMEQKTWQLKTQ